MLVQTTGWVPMDVARLWELTNENSVRDVEQIHHRSNKTTPAAVDAYAKGFQSAIRELDESRRDVE